MSDDRTSADGMPSRVLANPARVRASTGAPEQPAASAMYGVQPGAAAPSPIGRGLRGLDPC